MERIGEYFAISFCKFGKNFKKVGKSLEKIGKSLGEIPVSASDNMNSSRDIHYFSRMQHPLIWKNIYPWTTQQQHKREIERRRVVAKLLVV